MDGTLGRARGWQPAPPPDAAGPAWAPRGLSFASQFLIFTVKGPEGPWLWCAGFWGPTLFGGSSDEQGEGCIGDRVTVLGADLILEFS